ncbi:ABC transporter ATP-binding protein [Candidatus Methanomethylophilus sp. 1R26]|uniref:ABC transporter ATP-binding protein n=1 Tax=Candidatus Methanomethylophilus sp. 1R26 TaxID=1769296 RepID=UPI000B09D58C|nr:ABC transporter ATP-binding protein [Candidatus Methanomethylophilus sp. 1R26]
MKDGPRESGEPGREGTVEFRHVTFTYPGSDTAALSDVSFSVGKGETIAFIGPTGSGKSSIARLIPRLYDPDSGQVLVDGTDVREFRQTALHSRIGYVPQDAVIFTGTIRENVGYGGNGGERSEAEIREALDIAQASEFVSASPDGLDTRISQYGRNISGGQKQRVCIARAVCMRPEIYVFDDSFSALDFKTDLALRESLRKSTEGATRIIIAQRVGTIMDADRIAVVDGGRIVGLGTHDQLMQSCPIYRSIAESQLAGGA